MKSYFLEFELVGCDSAESAAKERQGLIGEGSAPAAARVIAVEPRTRDIMGAIEALDDMGDPDSLYVLSLIDRLLADDFTGTGLYQAIDNALKLHEPAVPASAE